MDFLVPLTEILLIHLQITVYGLISQRDFDKDGGDIDRCPPPAGVPVDDDGCAVSQKDTDQDGIYDNQDNCVEVPNENQLTLIMMELEIHVMKMTMAGLKMSDLCPDTLDLKS